MNDTTTLQPLTPLKLNRGQLIHSNQTKTPLIDYNSNDYKQKNDTSLIHSNVQVFDVICVDWFETTLTVKTGMIDQQKSEIKLSDEVYLINTGNRSKLYNSVWTVIFEGENIGTLQTHPVHSYMNENNGQFKIENHLLYSFDWLDTYFGLLASARWTHKNVTRLDISIDGSSIKKALDLIVKHEKSDTIGRKGKADFHAKKDPENKIKSFHVGSSSSEKYATIYKKSDEIEKSEKQYIKDFWYKNRLNDIKDVYRFELRLKSKITKHYDINRLNDPTYLASIVRTEVKNWFEFYYKGKDKNKHRTYQKSKDMNWIEWENIQGELLPKQNAVSTDTIYKAKRVIKDAFYFNHVHGKELPKKLLDDLLNEYCLHGWYHSKIEYWKNDFDREKRLKGFNSN